MLKKVSEIKGSVQEQLKEQMTCPQQEIRNKSSESESITYSSDSENIIGGENTIKTSLLYSINLMNNSIESITSIGTVQTETEEDEFKCQCFGRCNCTTVYSGILEERHASFTERTTVFEKQFDSIKLIQPGDKLFINTDNTVELDRVLSYLTTRFLFQDFKNLHVIITIRIVSVLIST